MPCGPSAAASVPVWSYWGLILRLCCSDTTLSRCITQNLLSLFYISPVFLFFLAETSVSPDNLYLASPSRTAGDWRLSAIFGIGLIADPLNCKTPRQQPKSTGLGYFRTLLVNIFCLLT
jgi:hypothetical protein